MKMHRDEINIDKALVRELLKQFPEYSNLQIERVDSCGTDNAIFKLGSDWAMRLPKISWAVGNIEKEATWLDTIAKHLPVKVPKVVALGEPIKAYPYSWLICEWLEGENPSEMDEVLLTDLVSCLRKFHRMSMPEGPMAQRGCPLREKDIETRAALEKLEGIVEVEALLSIWEGALSVPIFDGAPVWVHGDLSPWNLLTIDGRLSALIDFGNVGVGDPACDLLIAWNFMPQTMRYRFKKALEIDEATWERGRGWAVSAGALQLSYYQKSNPRLAESGRKMLEQLTNEFTFHALVPEQREMVLEWLGRAHVKEWIHGKGLQNTLDDLEKFFLGASEMEYWIGYTNGVPFAFLMTSLVGEEGVTLDVFICEESYLGMGLGKEMIKEFFRKIFPRKKKAFIDPQKSNTRAIHVYQSVGFKVMKEFIAPWHPVPHLQMEMDLKDL